MTNNTFRMLGCCIPTVEPRTQVSLGQFGLRSCSLVICTLKAQYSKASRKLKTSGQQGSALAVGPDGRSRHPSLCLALICDGTCPRNCAITGRGPERVDKLA